MADYPYTDLSARAMNEKFSQTVIEHVVRNLGKTSHPARQRLERTVRSASLSAPGFRPGKAPINRLAKPMVTLFRADPDTAYNVLALWMDLQPELRQRVAEHLNGLDIETVDELPAAGLLGWITDAEMATLARDLGADPDEDEARYDDTALMVCCLLAKAPLGQEEDEEAEDAGDDADAEAQAAVEDGEPPAVTE